MGIGHSTPRGGGTVWGGGEGVGWCDPSHHTTPSPTQGRTWWGVYPQSPPGVLKVDTADHLIPRAPCKRQENAADSRNKYVPMPPSFPSFTILKEVSQVWWQVGSLGLWIEPSVPSHSSPYTPFSHKCIQVFLFCQCSLYLESFTTQYYSIAFP